MDPVTIAMLGTQAIQSGVNYFRGKQDLGRIGAELDAMGDSPNYTLSSDYDAMVNMALNAPQQGMAMAERAYADQAAAAGQYGSRGLASLGAASRQAAQTMAGLEQQRMQGIQSALGVRAGAEQSVMNANVAQDLSEYTAERNRLLAEQAAAQEAVNAGITGGINVAGGLIAGAASGMQGTGFGSGMEAFINPQSGSSTSSSDLEKLLALYGLQPQPKQNANGGVTNAKEGVKTLSPGDSMVTEGPEDHDKLEYLIAKMVKAKDGRLVGLEPVARSTGGESHTVTKDGEMEVNNSQQLGSMKDGYDEYKRTGNWKNAINAMRRVFEQVQFKGKTR